MEAAVVSVSEGAIGSLLGKLGDLLAGNYKLLKEAIDDIMSLKAELESMRAFLERMSEAEEEPDKQTKCWANEVRDLSYDIEDNVDEFMRPVECESNSKPSGFFKGFIHRTMNLLTTMNSQRKIAKEFRGLKRRVVEASERRTRLHDMMLDLIIHKCREENFITATDDIQAMIGLPDKVRRLSLNLDGIIDGTVFETIQLSQYVCLESAIRFSLPSAEASERLWVFSRVPQWIGELHNLFDLDLAVEVLENDIGILAQLQSLSHLKLHIEGTPEAEDKLVIYGTGFPVLKYFRLSSKKISELTFEAGAMPSLQELEIRLNSQYGTYPMGIKHLLSLKKIRVEFLGRLLDDGFSWRKYGQKAILGAKHPRSGLQWTVKLTST
ncbi:hypothetical protein ACQ4PT_065119 [Festuca glaucescens]